MNNVAKIVLICGVALLGAPTASHAFVGECAPLEGAKPQAQLVFLEGNRSRMDDACIVQAMDQLAAARYEPAVRVLVKYLDYHVPIPPKKEGPEIRLVIPWLGTNYPAARGLFAIGLPAVSALVDIIGAADTSALVRKNAIELVFLIHRDNIAEGAAVLNRAGRAARDPGAHQRLMDAARELAGKCPEPERAACLSNALK